MRNIAKSFRPGICVLLMPDAVNFFQHGVDQLMSCPEAGQADAQP
jgi:hypothetical protein